MLADSLGQLLERFERLIEGRLFCLRIRCGEDQTARCSTEVIEVMHNDGDYWTGFTLNFV